MYIKNVFFVFLIMKVMSGRLKVIVLSVSMLRFQYSWKLSFSRTLAGMYLFYGLLSTIKLLLLLLLLSLLLFHYTNILRTTLVY